LSHLNKYLILIDVANATVNTSAASGAGFRVELFRFPYVFTQIPVSETYILSLQGILSCSYSFKARILTGINLSYFFKVGPVNQQETGTGRTYCGACTTRNARL
jgi:hypothetical protein